MVPRRIPLVLSPHGFGDPTSWFVHLVVFGRGARTVLPARESFLGLHPRFRVFPGGRGTVLQCLLLSRGFLPLQRHRSRTSHHSRSCLLRVLLRPCRFGSASTPCSRPDLPGVFQPGTLVGFSLQSLTRQGSHSPLGAASPLAIGVAASRYRTGKPFGGTRLPGPAPWLRRLSASARGCGGRRVFLAESRASRIIDGPW